MTQRETKRKPRGADIEKRSGAGSHLNLDLQRLKLPRSYLNFAGVNISGGIVYLLMWTSGAGAKETCLPFGEGGGVNNSSNRSLLLGDWKSSSLGVNEGVNNTGAGTGSSFSTRFRFPRTFSEGRFRFAISGRGSMTVEGEGKVCGTALSADGNGGGVPGNSKAKSLTRTPAGGSGFTSDWTSERNVSVSTSGIERMDIRVVVRFFLSGALDEPAMKFSSLIGLSGGGDMYSVAGFSSFSRLGGEVSITPLSPALRFRLERRSVASLRRLDGSVGTWRVIG